MINKKIEEALNKQINAELYSSYLYQSMAAYCEGINLKGFANWMDIQAMEEKSHAMKIYRYILERGGKINFTEIAAPKSNWENLITIFEEVYAHEQYITSLINNLTDLSLEIKDHASYNMLQWFIDEQVEEESNADDILQQLKLLDGKGAGLFMIDRELKSRVFVDSTQVK